MATPGFELANSSGMEVNSLLEVVINLAGGYNDLDEDGDNPEAYDAPYIAQPLIDTSICLMRPNVAARKIFFLRNETMLPSEICKTIDHPPEMT